MYYIIQKNVITETADSKERAIQQAILKINADPAAYIVALTKDEYNKHLSEDQHKCDKKAKTEVFRQKLAEEYGLTDPEVISEIANDAYDRYREGHGATEDECLEDAFNEVDLRSLIQSETVIDRKDGYCVIAMSEEHYDLAVEGKNVRVEWYDAGEGTSGDYNPDDPDDVHLLRFDVYHRDETTGPFWSPVDDASYCTNTPISTDRETLVKLLVSIYKEYANVLEADPYQSVKKLGEELSWISPDDIKS